MTDEEYMREVLALLEPAEDPPIACIIADESGEIIARAGNSRQREVSAIAHAEINAIEEACKRMSSWHLVGCTLYVTLEPCPMCMGAIINSRIDRVVFGAYNPKAGCCGSIVDLSALPFNHRPAVRGGVLAEECGRVLSEFFRRRRGE